jgi:murein DD-endopeptidase MepM/ murein hydrolase activator NlpD
MEFTQSVTIDVAHIAYSSSALSVARKYTEPDAATAERIVGEQALKKEILAAMTPRRQWSGDFIAPLDSVTTEHFGTQRTFNGAVQSVHQGLDYRASEGTPVRAINTGTVILARDLFFEGNCVVIDHGQGLLSLYFHLSSMNTGEGDAVEKGQILGHSGATGRVTAAHLHLAIRWQGAYLDPARLLKLALN